MSRDKGITANELADVLNHLQTKVDVSDRIYKGKKYPLCFVGTEATDVLAVGRSRSEAIKVGPSVFSYTKTCTTPDCSTYHHYQVGKAVLYMCLVACDRFARCCLIKGTSTTF